VRPMRKNITYYIETGTGIVIARRGESCFVPVLLYERLGRDGDYRGPLQYRVERFPALETILAGKLKPIGRGRVPERIKDRFRKVIEKFDRAKTLDSCGPKGGEEP
jgi:hypothetical protein